MAIRAIIISPSARRDARKAPWPDTEVPEQAVASGAEQPENRKLR
jgi:hypothetical protein